MPLKKKLMLWPEPVVFAGRGDVYAERHAHAGLRVQSRGSPPDHEAEPGPAADMRLPGV